MLVFNRVWLTLGNALIELLVHNSYLRQRLEHQMVKFPHSPILLLNKSVFTMERYCFCHCSMGLCGNFTHQIIDDSLNNDCNAVRLTVRRQLIFAGISELWLIYITRPKTTSILLFHHVLSPSHLHSTHNYTISISTSTALCLNYNDFVMNKGCQFWHGTKQITLWGRSVFEFSNYTP